MYELQSVHRYSLPTSYPLPVLILNHNLFTT